MLKEALSFEAAFQTRRVKGRSLAVPFDLAGRTLFWRQRTMKRQRREIAVISTSFMKQLYLYHGNGRQYIEKLCPLFYSFS